MGWRDAAACRDADQSLFFPEWGGSRLAEAREVCATCTVTAECLAEALTVQATDDFGVWAGTTADERRHMRRRRRRADTPGDVLRDTRRALGMLQTEAARAAGIDQSDISRMERDLATPRPGTVEKIEKALGVTDGRLMTAWHGKAS